LNDPSRIFRKTIPTGALTALLQRSFIVAALTRLMLLPSLKPVVKRVASVYPLISITNTRRLLPGFMELNPAERNI
jgi:hypothetical protein